MKSLIKEIGPVQFPANTGERVYMLPFTKRAGLPASLSRWQPTIDSMLLGVDVDGPIYLMIDQGIVKAGTTHRRGGPHIDGNWNPGVTAHGHPASPGHITAPLRAPGHLPMPPRHGTTPTPVVPPGHAPNPSPGHSSARGGWAAENFSPEALILASDVTASCAYVGEIDGDPVEGGDCSHLDLSMTARVPLIAGVAYAGNVTMVHESLPVLKECRRTLVRLNVPGFIFEQP